MNTFKKILVTAVVLSLSGCATTRVTSSWKAPGAEPQSYSRIMVLGLINEPDRTLREKMEQHIVGDLNSLGFSAVCSCEEFNPKTFENLEEKEAILKLRNSGIDAVLTVVLLDKTRERYYVPNRVMYSPYVVYQGRFWGYYTTIYDRVYAPGYYQTDTRYFWESNLYDLRQGKESLVYSVQTQSFDPASAYGLAHEYGQLIVKDMVKHQVLAPGMQKAIPF